jgi:uncharacterized membrane protein
MRNHRRNREKSYSNKPFDSNGEFRQNNILPAPGILESYEEISPGSVKIIMDMAKTEQAHRHKWENDYLRAMAYTSRVGQLLGFALAVILIYSCIILSVDRNEQLASVIAFSGFAFLMIAALASAKSRAHISRPRRHFEAKDQAQKQ